VSELGVFFPEQERIDYAKRALTPGRVLYLFCPFTVPPKEKYAILLSLGNPTLLFLINSRIHDYIADRPDLAACQLLIAQSDHEFLAHDSYIDCSNAIDDFSDKDVLDQITGDISRVKGTLNPRTIQDMKRIVRQARTISAFHARIILSSL
jgi:hypothetical protein